MAVEWVSRMATADRNGSDGIVRQRQVKVGVINAKLGASFELEKERRKEFIT